MFQEARLARLTWDDAILRKIAGVLNGAWSDDVFDVRPRAEQVFGPYYSGSKVL
jgi:hypothetical protein